jgi:hypothetical protein
MQRSRPVTDRQTDRPEGKQGKRKDADNMKSRQMTLEQTAAGTGEEHAKHLVLVNMQNTMSTCKQQLIQVNN